MNRNRRCFIKQSSALMATSTAGLMGLQKSAHAATGKAPVRFITVMNALGIMDAARDEHLVKTPTDEVQALQASDFRTAIDPFMNFRDNMIVMQGLNNASAISQGTGSHAGGAAHVLTGGNIRSGNTGTLVTTTGPSLDVHIANLIASQAGTPYRHLNFNTGGLGGEGGMSFCYDNNGVQVPRLVGPQKIYQRLFASPVDDGGPKDKFSLEAKIAVLESVGKNITQLKQNLPGMSAKESLNFYQSSIEQLAGQFNSQANFMPSASCENPGAPKLDFDRLHLTPDQIQVKLDKQLDRDVDATLNMAFQALNCNFSRVLTMDFGGVQPKITYPWLADDLQKYGSSAGMGRSESHGISHQGSDAAAIYMCVLRNYYAKKYAQLCQRLADTPDSDGSSMLDNTVFLWISEVSRGADHGMDNYPVTVLAGKNTGFKQGGLNCKFDGRSLNDLYTTILKASNLPHTSFGSKSSNTGTIDALLA
ncbi:DUF1552 domain-containing protein [Marinagarivorans algicola]|uniref:DUF1552 domain-containing protein n=1 Tax=Marinagarivorans algicola TaxID=1513270 RepID=UPI0037360D24